MASKKPNNFYKQELLQQLISECGYSVEEVNNANPRKLIEMFINSYSDIRDVDTIIALVNGAFNVDIEKHYKL